MASRLCTRSWGTRSTEWQCDLGLEVVFEVQAPQQPVTRRELKSIEAASRYSFWETHIKPAVRAEIEKIFEVHKSVVFSTRRDMYDKTNMLQRRARSFCSIC